MPFALCHIIFILDSKRFILYWVFAFLDLISQRGGKPDADNYSQIQQIDTCDLLFGCGIDAI